MKISLILATKNPITVQNYIKQVLSISPLFDEIVIHNNTPENVNIIPHYINTKIINESQPISSGEAFNKAISISTGDWLLCHTDDDFCSYGRLSNLIRDLKSGDFKNTDIIYTRYYVGNENTGFYLTPQRDGNLEQENYIPFTSFYKRKVWEDVKGYKNMPFCDWLFWMEAQKLNKKFSFYDNPYFYFRQHHKDTPSLADQEYSKQPFEVTRQQLIDFVEGI